MGNRTKLSKQRLNYLLSLKGWVWNKLDAAWEENYSNLRPFETYKEMPVQNYIAKNGFKLGIWLAHQRKIKIDYQKNN